jgi:UDP-glucuronate decarboxylase
VGTIETLNKLNQHGKYLFLSTSELYSGLSASPFSENQIGTTNTNHPRSCYIEGKRCGETLVNAARSGGIHATSGRLSLAYGPGTRRDDARVVNSFIKKAITEGKIEMMDQGNALRTYMYITDAVTLMFKILFFGTMDVYNIGGTSRTTIKNLAEDIGNILGVPVSFPTQTVQGVIGAPEDVCLNMERIEKEFGPLDLISLEEGLKKTISWQKMLYT